MPLIVIRNRDASYSPERKERIEAYLRVVRVLDSPPKEDEVVVDSDRINRWWH